MGLIPNRKQWLKWSASSKWSYLSSFFSLIGAIFGLMAFFIQPTVSSDIKQKIQELNEIRTALSTLDTYVENQQNSLKKLSVEKLELEKEREKIEKILQIDREKINALFDYQAAVEGRRAWLEILISFFIGVLSSSVVTFFAIRMQNKKDEKEERNVPHNQANSADAKSRAAD